MGEHCFGSLREEEERGSRKQLMWSACVVVVCAGVA